MSGKLRYRALYLRNGANVKSPKLTPFSYVILVLVGERGAGPHDLVRMMRDGRIYWTAPESPVLRRAQAARAARLPDRDQAAGPHA